MIDTKREIKFRAWIKDDKSMWEVEAIDFHKQVVRIDWQPQDGSRLTEGIDFEEVKLMQYTGLKDKNGKEIYEGDIVRFADKGEWYKYMYCFEKTREEIEGMPYGVGEVKWDGRNSGWSVGVGATYEASTYLEVIGNVFENPELLE